MDPALAGIFESGGSSVITVDAREVLEKAVAELRRMKAGIRGKSSDAWKDQPSRVAGGRFTCGCWPANIVTAWCSHDWSRKWRLE